MHSCPPAHYPLERGESLSPLESPDLFDPSLIVYIHRPASWTVVTGSQVPRYETREVEGMVAAFQHTNARYWLVLIAHRLQWG